MHSKLKKIAIGLFVLLVLICAGVPTLLWSMGGGKPNIAVDYEEKLNERAAAVPEGDRAWPIYRDVVIAIADVPRSELDALSEPDWREANRAAFDARMDMLSEHLNQIRLAARKPGLGFDTTASQPTEFWDAVIHNPPRPRATGEAPPLLLGAVFPQLGQFRLFAKLLDADAWLAAEVGEPDRFIGDIDAMLSIADHTEEHSTLINQLVALSIRAMTYERITSTIAEQPDLLDESALSALQSRLAGMHGGEEYRLDMIGERYFFEDVLQRVYSDDGNGNGKFTAEGLAFLGEFDGYGLSLGNRGGDSGKPPPGARVLSGAVRLYASDRKTVTDSYDRFLDHAEQWSEQPLWERGDPDDEAWQELDAASRSLPPDPGMMMVSILVPAYSKAFLSLETVNQHREATETALAVARYRAIHGSWPDSLDDFVPSLLAAVPIDRFTGDPLRYALTDMGPILYSVGTDRDDDGGRAASGARRWVPADEVERHVAENPAEHDGDLVFFGKSVVPRDEDAASD